MKENFSFTSENLQHVKEHLAKYPPDRQASAILPILDLAQRQCDGWLPKSAIEAVAELLNMPVIRVYEIATFYTMFHLEPVGKYHVQVCGTTPCLLRGAAEIIKACQNHLSIDEGQVTDDGLFSLTEVECLGACVNAPVVQINDDFYEDLTPDSIKNLLDQLRKGKKPSPGSLVGRQASSPLKQASDAE